MKKEWVGSENHGRDGKKKVAGQVYSLRLGH